VIHRQDGRRLIGRGRDLNEDANVTDEHDDRRYEEDDEVDEGQVRLSVADRSLAKDRLADCFVCDNVDVEDGQLWNGQQGRDCPTDSSHSGRLHDNNKNNIKITRRTFLDGSFILFCLKL